MIFPDWGTAPETNESPLPLFREWAVDWESGALALRCAAASRTRLRATRP